MKGGGSHPRARTPVLSCTLPELGGFPDEWKISITRSRLAFFFICSDTPTTTAQLTVWDWTTGEILLVCSKTLFRSPLMRIACQELKNNACRFATFIDDFWLALVREEDTPLQPAGLTLLNTKEITTDGGEFVQTTFCPNPARGVRLVGLVSDLGGHEPSRVDARFAPFYPDVSQRVLAIRLSYLEYFLVVKEETLLRLAQERKGENLRWEEWKDHGTPIVTELFIQNLWVSGPRIRYVYPNDSEELYLNTYDFSARASARGTELLDNLSEQGIHDLVASCGCEDNIVFVMVKTIRSSELARN
jgi:hypothetical protein